MAQLKCPECGKTFDDTEQACPNCGCPVSLMATQESGRLSKSQNRMIALAMPIGIMALLIVLQDVFDLICTMFNFEMFDSKLGIVIQIIDYLFVLITFTLLLIWFLSLSKGSVKRSKTKKISVVAIVGISCFILYSIFLIWVRLTLYISNRGSLTLFNGWTIVNYFLNLIKYIMFGGAFCALSGLFKGNMKVYALLTGILFLLTGALGGIFPNGNRSLQWVFEGLSILRYITIALFFFGFSKTYKS